MESSANLRPGNTRMCYHSYLYLAHISERVPGSGANMTSCCRPAISMYIRSKPESPLSQPRCVIWLPSDNKLHKAIKGEIKLTSTIDGYVVIGGRNLIENVNCPLIESVVLIVTRKYLHFFSTSIQCERWATLVKETFNDTIYSV